MRRFFTFSLLCGIGLLSACADQPAAPPLPGELTPGRPAALTTTTRIATLGTLVRRDQSTLVLRQEALGFKSGPSWHVKSLGSELAIGDAGNELLVVIEPTTPVYLQNARVASLDAVPLGVTLLVAGSRAGNDLRADLVTDLTPAATPPPAHALDHGSDRPRIAAPALGPQASVSTASVTSLCLGQDMDYTAADIHEFHGCWGGPSASDNIDVPGILGLSGIPFFCPIAGCFVIDEYSYTFALGGWAYDFPFRFGATAPGLTYHVPGNVSLSLAALPASGTAFTFTGGLGFDYGLNFDFCPLIGDCANLGTIHLNILSMIHQTTGAGPLRPSQRLDIAEVGCPSVGVLVIPNVPIDPLALGLCEDLGLTGRAFNATVTAEGATQLAATRLAFDGANQSLTVRPDALTLSISYSEFSWAPEMTMGFFFRLKSFGVTLIDSPTIPLTSGAFEPVSTPFPKPGSDFTVATDPLSPIDDLRYLFQPTAATVAVLPVARAPTTLTIVSPAALAEGQPVHARLTESYDGSPIAGAVVLFTVTDAAGSSVVPGTTDASGVAQVALPNGEYAVQPDFAGSSVYLPSVGSQAGVFVYHATTFVIWGGNAEGISAGQSYQFWGSEWYTQVTGGDYTAGQSFKGFAHTTSGATWIAGGGNSTRPPTELPQYIAVIVATSATTANRSSIVGNIAGRAILRVDDLASYGAEPGHPGFGTLRAVIAN
jgi:hypothetical protein